MLQGKPGEGGIASLPSLPCEGLVKALPYFKFYPGDAETDENFRSMDDAEKGFYWRCLNHSWLNCGLPADPDERARALGSDRKYADKQWVRVGRCFSVSPEDASRVVNRRQEEERLKAKLKSERATKSVRTRYERNYERSTDESLRALTPAVYESESSVVAEVSSQESEPRARVKAPAVMLGDESWPKFMEHAKEQGVDGSGVDWNEAQWEWSTMSFEERIAAHRGLELDVNGRENCLPKNYLKRRMWQRPARKQSKTSAQSREDELMRILEDQANA